MNHCIFPCYNCKSRYCSSYDDKLDRLAQRFESQIKEGLNWIDIDFEEDDEVGKRALQTIIEFLKLKGFKFSTPSYKTWIVYTDTGDPCTDCGYHAGTLYFKRPK